MEEEEEGDRLHPHSRLRSIVPPWTRNVDIVCAKGTFFWSRDARVLHQEDGWRELSFLKR